MTLVLCSEAVLPQTTEEAKRKHLSETPDLERVQPVFTSAGCPVPTGGSVVGPELPGCTSMSEDLSAEENGVGHLYSESVPQLREYLSQASADHTWSSESTVTSSESGSDILHMTSGDLDCKSLCKKEEEARSASAMPGTSPAPETAVLGDSGDAGDAQGVDKAASHLSLAPLCEDDNQAQEIIKKLEKSITFLSQCTTRVASRAEMLGAINQESRVSKAVEVMIQHVENLKRMYAKEHAELGELKQALLQNERSFSPLEDEDDCQIKKRSSSLNSKPSSLRRVTIASLPRNLGNMGMVYGIDNNDRFSRRSSSWRILGTKPSEHRPSLQRFISTYSWADTEDDKCDEKTRDASEPAGEEVVERTRKASVSEKRSSPSTWDSTAVCSSVASWVTHLQVSCRRANKVLWLSVVFIVLFAALMSFLTGQFFQTAVEAAPTQEGTSWMSLEHVLWPLTRLRHNGPPPV
ncbi:lymphoid-restricted membrane protein [Cricetulus griseus]|nr:lymphoid-restricted membrane protein [Cricetulus griseus]